MHSILFLLAIMPAVEGDQLLDVTEEVGLGGISAARVCFLDLNRDGYSDLVVDRHRVFLNVSAETEATAAVSRRFVEVPTDETGLPEPVGGGPVIFADLDNDGILDAIVARFVDQNKPDWEDHGKRTSWCKGLGEGRFWPEQPLQGVPAATTSAAAVGDWDRDGRLDLYLGNWYWQYGESYDGYPNHLMLQTAEDWGLVEPAEQGITLQEADPRGRPTYGVLMAQLAGDDAVVPPNLIDLNYGRRWNRLWLWVSHQETILDAAPLVGFDGDSIRHGRYPDWLKERAKDDARFDRPDEDPFRANGNSFDAAIGDVDNDGDFDVLISEITHGWAGESSDRTRVLLNRFAQEGRLAFESRPEFNMDRIPAEKQNWNQGDLFADLADLDQDGWLDVIISSGDYPDDQRLRIYHNLQGRGLEQITTDLGVDHDGSQQLSLGDVDGDGALDLVVGQTFFRYTAEMKEGRSPRLRLLLNRCAESRGSLVLRLEGDPRQGVNRDALGAIVEAQVGEFTLVRQLVPVGGHSGKQHDFLVHFGLGEAPKVDRLTVRWPGEVEPEVFENVDAGSYRLRQGANLAPMNSAGD